MLVRALSATIAGLEAIPVEVETDISKGLPALTIVGLPAGPVRESADRIRAAIRNCGYPFPGRRITINLAPAEIRKEGALLDLPIALAILCAAGAIPGEVLGRFLAAGELSLDGSLKPVRGVLSQGLLAKEMGLSGLIVPRANALEASLVPGISVLPVASLRDAAEALAAGGRPPTAPGDPQRGEPARTIEADGEARARPPLPDLRDVVGQPVARRALEIAAAGHHALLLVGPPGCGKTMLAERLPGLLPEPTESEALQTARIYSAAGEPPWPRLPLSRPFRAPHHGITPAGLVGGGNPPRPGEITFAHGGVLFLDELSEFGCGVREALREPLESGEIRIARAGGAFRFPCRFLLVAASNPCPCGYRGHPRKGCRCPPPVIARFWRRFSGPLLDRIDLSVAVPPVAGEDWAAAAGGEPSEAVRIRVAAARERQADRYGRPGAANGAVRAPFSDLVRHLTPDARTFLARTGEALGLSGRAMAKVGRVALTIADLAGERRAALPHVAEAIQHRLPDNARIGGDGIAEGG